MTTPFISTDYELDEPDDIILKLWITYAQTDN